MSLSCECDFDSYGSDWFYYEPVDYSMLDTNKRQRCCECKELIDVGAIVSKFNRCRHPTNDIEERIHGEDGEIELAYWYMCETCSDIYFSLSGLGFCMTLGKDVRKTLKEYHEVYNGQE